MSDYTIDSVPIQTAINYQTSTPCILLEIYISRYMIYYLLNVWLKIYVTRYNKPDILHFSVWRHSGHRFVTPQRLPGLFLTTSSNINFWAVVGNNFYLNRARISPWYDARSWLYNWLPMGPNYDPARPINGMNYCTNPMKHYMWLITRHTITRIPDILRCIASW